jgi:hypothetical protein
MTKTGYDITRTKTPAAHAAAFAMRGLVSDCVTA